MVPSDEKGGVWMTTVMEDCWVGVWSREISGGISWAYRQVAEEVGQGRQVLMKLGSLGATTSDRVTVGIIFCGEIRDSES